MQMTLAILKPDSVEAGNAGNILALLEREGFKIRGMKMLCLSQSQAQAFYEVHKERPFFRSLVTFMTEAPVVMAVLEADDAIQKLRKVMGATDPAKADAGAYHRPLLPGVRDHLSAASQAPPGAARVRP